MNTGWLSLNEEQRRTTLEQASIRSGIETKAIEKDWWVTLCLRALFNTPYAQYCIFKGGTSLSKGWNLIQRFSEDIDIALTPDAFGMEYQLQPSHSYVKQLKRKGCEFTSTIMKAALEQEFEELGIPPGMLTIEAEEITANLPDKDPQTLFIRYPSIIDPHPYLAEEVKMEFGVRALKEPFVEIPIVSILSDVFPNPVYKDIPFEVTVVEPRKTLMEKMFLLHEKFSSQTPATIKGDRQSRHLYDIVQLMNTKAGKEVLEDTTLYSKLIEHRRSYVRLKEVDYDTLVQTRLTFIPSIEWIDDFRKDYELMQEYMIYGESLPFDELLNELKLFNGRVRLVGTGMSLDEVIKDFLDEHQEVIDTMPERRILRSFLDTKTPDGEPISFEVEMHFIRKKWLFQNIRRVYPSN